jgi:hypothetical protein
VLVRTCGRGEAGAGRIFFLWLSIRGVMFEGFADSR